MIECDNCYLPIEEEKAVVDKINDLVFCSNTCRNEHERDMGIEDI